MSTEKTREEENQGILQLRILRTQEAIIKILKMRKRISKHFSFKVVYRKKLRRYKQMVCTYLSQIVL